MLYQIVVPALFEPYRAVAVEETGNESHHEITLINGHRSNRRSERLVFLVHRITDLSGPTRPFSLIRVSAWDRSLLGLSEGTNLPARGQAIFRPSDKQLALPRVEQDPDRSHGA